MTPAATPHAKLKLIYEMTEQKYLRSLPLEHFMESTTQATQRKITMESFDLIQTARPDVQCFNELLVQYPREDEIRPGQVVPDNMVVIHPKPIVADGSFNTPLQPVGPFLVLEYVSKHNKRKDYEENMVKYQNELQVPYYLLFYPDNEELSLFRLAGDRYVTVTPNEAGRYSIPELELEVALQERWVRYWFRGELQPLPADLLRMLDSEREARKTAELRAEAAELHSRTADQRAEAAELHSRTAEQRAEAAESQAAADRQARLSLEAELARIRDELASAKRGPEGA